MDINILVRPVYGRQRAQSTGISELDVSYALCVPMSIYIGRVGLYVGPLNLDMLRNWSASRLQLLIGTPTDRSLCYTSVALSDRRISTKHWNLCQLRFSERLVVYHISISPKALTCYEIG
jgi:hypothetical protein